MKVSLKCKVLEQGTCSQCKWPLTPGETAYLVVFDDLGNLCIQEILCLACASA